jgi:hypothetical protein
MTNRVTRFCCDCGRDTLGNTYRDDEGKDRCANHALRRCSELMREQKPISFRNVERDAEARTEKRARRASRVLKMAKGSRG